MRLFTKKTMCMTALCMSFLVGICTIATEKEHDAKAAGEYGISNPVVDGGYSVWDCVSFGSYYQEDTNGDGIANEQDEKTPVKWRVLSVNGDDAFLLADKNLDCQRYNEEKDITWEECSLRAWLNGEFSKTAFNSKEQEAIQETTVKSDVNPKYGTSGGNDTTDKVFILSLSEVSNKAYGFDEVYYERSKTREAKNTGYAVTQGAFHVEETEDNKEFIGNGQWWLRTPGQTNTYVAGVSYHGFCADGGLNVGNIVCSVRPALHISLSSSVWKNAGKINSYGEELDKDGKPVATASPEPGKEEKKVSVPKVKGFQISSPKTKTVLCEWKVNKSVKKCEIQFSDDKKFSNPKIVQENMSKGKYQGSIGNWTVCYARMRSYITSGARIYHSKWTAVKKVTIALIDPPKDIKGFQLSTKMLNDQKIIFTWKRGKSSEKCEMYLSKTKNFKKAWLEVQDMNTGKFQFGGASKGTYYGKMRSFVELQGKKYYSNWTKVKMIKVK